MSRERNLIEQIQSYTKSLLQTVADAQSWHYHWLEEANQQYQKNVVGFETKNQQVLKELQSTYEQQIKQATHLYQERLTDVEATYQQATASAKRSYKDVIDNLFAPEYQQALATEGVAVAEWTDGQWQQWQPSSLAEAALPRLGKLVEKGQWQSITLPATPHLIGGSPLLGKAKGAGRQPLVSAIQSYLLRLLAILPPAKVRFTFLDPIGLGQNAAPFMHLADYDEQLVTSRAWTEPSHIEQRLADLTEHMETVIQKYLRNQYAIITEYNAQAGEVAEPYRVLVVYDFPTNFSETAARRLVSIAQNGPRCGVYPIILVDLGKPLPYGFKLADLEQNATVIAWDGKRFVWEDADFRDCLLELDEPPPSERFDQIVKSVGEAAKNASKVEVPFERIIPTPNGWWQQSAQDGLDVALGPAGARKLQNFMVGRGTAQHALVAGRTGSGKSNLLNVLITNIALNYSPEEVELYLIDFKKGVEFKAYATHQLPHARVIAIEGEREFGLSVLQGLDAELTRRATPFKNAGVDGLADFRKKTGETLARILLLVDEFQEFFAEDDAIATQSAQILDRLVRQGRSFGLHVMLGSQTLAGSYTLPRSTIDQMGVRIALQCTEADSRLILADDNPAARLLSRAGEAIYNAANGRVEGNSPFQVAMLTDEMRERYLAEVKQLTAKRNYKPTHPQIIFEGNAPAEVQKNTLLTALLDNQTLPPLGRKVAAWLGEPIAIKEPTAAYFRRQSGSNLLIVGQNDEQALGMMETMLISLLAQHARTTAKFYIADFSMVDAVNADHFKNLVEQLPTGVHYGRRRELPAMLNEIKDEADQRLSGEGDESNRAIYLFIYGLHRARDLRQEEGMGFAVYSFGASNEAAAPPSPAQQFPVILQEGPELGIHTVAWCDTVANLNRVVERRALREFEMRVAFQMGAEDSANLIDSPAANRLGPYRALFVSEEEGRMEKFRPYGLPAEEWVGVATQKLIKSNHDKSG